MSGVSAEERVSRARAAQKIWSLLPAAERRRLLRALRLEFAAQRDRLVDTIVRETAKPPLDALSGDVLVTLEQMRYYERRAENILRARKVSKPSLLYRGARFREQYQPHGVALIFGPWNYPLQLSMVPAITALYARNAVIVKCSERVPLTAALIEELCRRVPLPEDLVQVVHHDPEEAGALVDALPDLIFFTGSSENGRAIAQRAAAHLIPAVLELGGKDAAIVFKDCDLERTVEGITYGAFAHAGQVCVGVKRLYVEKSIYSVFLEKLVARVAGLRIGTGPDCDIGPCCDGRTRSLVAAQVEDALEHGAKLAYPRDSALAGRIPVILTDVSRQSRLLCEESFGPVLCVAPFSGEAQAIEMANDSSFALGASVWTRDVGRGQRVAEALNTGTCAINDVIRNIANPHAAFGGNGASGYGRYHGPAGLLAFSRIKTVMTAAPRRREINWFPFTQKTLRGLGTLIEFRHRARGFVAVLRRVLPLAFLLLSCAVSCPAKAAGHLLIEVTLPGDAHGSIGYLVFASRAGFPNDRNKALRRDFAPVSSRGSKLQIDAGALPPGHYAVTVYLDENNNHRLDSNLLGIPKEPVGASNNPKPRMGPPRFDDCAFEMREEDQTISITLVRPG